EPPGSLGTGAAQRVQHALARVHPVEIARNLGAEHAAGRGMVRRAVDPDRAAVLHGHVQRAGVRAVVRAGAEDDLGPGSSRGGTVERHRAIVRRRRPGPPRSTRRLREPRYHWTTRSARAPIDGGMVMPSSRARLRFTARMVLDSSSTGRSAGFAPLKILSM